MRSAVLVLGMVFFSSYAWSQDQSATEAKPGVYCSLGSAVTWVEWDFSWGEDVDIPSSLWFAGGLSYGSFPFVGPTTLTPSVDVSYVHFEAERSAPSSALDLEFMPIMIWCALSSKGSFGPFVHLGVGAAKVEYAESNEILGSHAFDHWSFAYGWGGGVFYSPADRIEMRFVVEGVATTRDQVEEYDLTWDYWPLGWTGGWFSTWAVQVIIKM